MPRFNFNLPDYQKEKLKKRKKKRGKSIAQQIRDAIHKDLKGESSSN